MASLWEIRSVDQLALALRDNILSPKLWLHADHPSFEKLENKGKFDASIEAVRLGSLRAVRVKVPASRFQFPDCGSRWLTSEPQWASQSSCRDTPRHPRGRSVLPEF